MLSKTFWGGVGEVGETPLIVNCLSSSITLLNMKTSFTFTSPRFADLTLNATINL